jgi:hypothetical protein
MQPQTTSEVTANGRGALRLLDLAVGVSGHGLSTAAAAGRGVVSAGRPLIHLALRPPVLAHRHQPATWLENLSRQGDRQRDELTRQVAALLDFLVPRLVDQVLRRVDAAQLVHEYVDLDEIISDVDLDSVLGRVDKVALVREVIDELDLPELIRESTSTVASDSVRGLRMHSISGDDAIARAVARLRARRSVTTSLPSPDGTPGVAGPTTP